jgi:hypothetical protein
LGCGGAVVLMWPKGSGWRLVKRNSGKREQNHDGSNGQISKYPLFRHITLTIYRYAMLLTNPQYSDKKC